MLPLFGLLVAKWTIESLLGLPQVSDPQIRLAGDMYAYVVNGDVLVARVDGGAPSPVHSGRRPRWSPDSRQLAFVAAQDGIDQIFLYDVVSGGIRQFTHSPSAPGLYSWAPDGRAIAFLA